jgi:hypothetical protein
VLNFARVAAFRFHERSGWFASSHVSVDAPANFFALGCFPAPTFFVLSPFATRMIF